MKDHINCTQTAIDALRLLNEYDLAKETIHTCSFEWSIKMLKYCLSKARVQKNHEVLDMLTCVFKYV